MAYLLDANVFIQAKNLRCSVGSARDSCSGHRNLTKPAG